MNPITMRTLFAKAIAGLLPVFAILAPVTAQAQTAVNTGRVAVPSGFVDPTPGNNESIDTDTILVRPKLTLVKSVINTGGGTAAASAWTLSATGPSTISGVSGNVAVTAATVTAGTYTLSETGGPATYTAGTWSCVVNGGTAVSGNSIALVNGDVATCTITNTFNRPRIRLVKELPLGRLDPADQFALTLQNTVTSAITVTGTSSGAANAPQQVADALVDAGVLYLFDEEMAAGSARDLSEYIPTTVCTNANLASTTTLPNAVGSGFPFTLAAGDDVTCKLENRPAPRLTLVKSVVNTGGGTAAATDWTLEANSPTWFPISGASGDAIITDLVVGEGVYTLSESGGPANYSASAWNCTAGSLAGNDLTLAAGDFATCTITNTFQSADLAISKTDSQTSVDAGGTTTYTITVTNNGPTAVTGAILSDPVATGLDVTNVACAGTPGECVTAPSIAQLQSGAFALPVLASGDTYSIAVTADVTATSGTVTNAATIAPPAGIADPTPDNNSASDQNTINPIADLKISKSSGGPNLYRVNDTITYTIRVTNDGPSSATNAILADAVASGLSKTSVACSATPGKCVTAPSIAQLESGSFTLPTLASGEFYEITLAAKVTTTAEVNLDNIATVTAPVGVSDPDTGNNSGTATDFASTESDLRVTKTDGVTSVNTGATTTYTIRVENIGPGDWRPAAEVAPRLVDPAVVGLTKTAVACSPTPGLCATAPTIGDLEGGSFALPLFKAGEFYEITVDATVDATSGTVTNTVNIPYNDGGNEIDPANDEASDTDTVVPLPKLTLVKSVVNTGGGTAAATDWTLNATGPSSISGVSAAPAVTSAAVAAGTYALTETGGPAGYTASPYSCVVNAASAVSGNSVALTFGDVATCTITNTFVPAPALTVVKSATPPATLAVGQKITYGFAVENTGNVQMTGIAISDAKLDAAATCLATTLAPGATTSCSGEHTITQTDIDAGGVPNSATVSGNPPTGPATTSPPSTANTPIAAAPALTLDKQAPVGSLTVGTPISYTVIATNSGNITQSNVVVSDPMLTPGSTTCVSLAPGATCTLTGTYTVQQSDVDAGKIENTASVSSVQVTTPVTDKVSTPIAAAPALTLDKQAPVGSLTVGTPISYTVIATNSGNTTQSNVVVSDPMLTPGSTTCVSLAPGATCTLTGTYTVQQSDVDAGKIENTASVSSVQVTTPVTDKVSTPIAAAPALTLDKQAPVGSLTVGTPISYTVIATNSGNTTQSNVVVSDPMLTPGSTTCVSLAPGATCTLTGTYTVQQSDVDAGKIENTASVSSVQVTTPVTDKVSTPIAAAPALTLDKQAPVGSLTVGTPISYTVIATNSGNITQSNVVVSDPMLTPGSTTCVSLAPGATCTLTGTYTVQQSDVDAGKIENTASVSSVQVTTPVTDKVSTPIAAAPALTLDKQAPVGSLTVGTPISYTVIATNSGNTTQSNVVVSDPMLTPGSTTCVSLAPGATCTLTGTYTVQQSDVDAGKIENTASVSSVQVTTPVTDKVSTPIAAAPALTLDKQAPVGSLTVGTPISYTVIATNSGNITQSNVVVSDPMLTPGSTTCVSLAPGATCTLTGTYTVQQSDVDAGKIENTASVSSVQVTTPVTDKVSTPIAAAPALTLDKQAPVGSLTVGTPISYTVIATNSGNTTQSNVVVSDPMLTPGSTTCVSLAPGATCTLTGTYTVQQSDVDAGKIENTASVSSVQVTTPVTDKVSTPIAAAPALTLDKQAPVGSLTVGTPISYTVIATNSGNITQSNVVVSDPMLTPGSTTCVSLAPGATCTLTGTYTVQQSDVDAGKIENTASVSSVQVTTPVTDKVSTPIAAAPALTLDKQAPVGSLTVGTPISYTVIATNSGNTTQSNVVVSDPMLTPGSTTCVSLAPGATCTLTGTYTVQQSDVDAGKIENTASVSSVQVTTPVTDKVSTPIAAAPALTLDKQAPVGSLTVGTPISYTVIATNSGNITQSNVVVSDPMLTPGSTTCVSLAPGATCTLTGTYTVQQSDVDAGKIENTASVSSVQVTTPVTDKVSTPIAAAPALTLDKQAPVGSLTVGTPISYTVIATNSGNTTQSNVVVSDPMLTPGSTTCVSLAPGATCTLTGTYTVQQSDVDAGKIENTASVSSVQVTTPVTDKVSTPIAAAPALTLDKQAPVGSLTVGTPISYTVIATNSGNTTQSNVVVSDPMLTPGSTTCVSLAPGATCTLTGTYTVQQSDVDAGKIENTASVSSVQVTTPVTDKVSTPIAAAPALSLDKQAPSGSLTVGSSLSYTVVATNSGNTTQSGVTVSDPKLTPGTITCATLAPGATCTLSGTYVVTQADVDAGTIDNTASVSSTQVTTPVTDSVSTPIAAAPALSLDKQAPSGSLTVGSSLSYTVVATNSGNTTQSGVTVSDPKLTPGTITCATLAPGATCTLSGTYVLTPADVNSGALNNTASVSSTQVTTPVTDSVSTPLVPAPIAAVDDSATGVNGTTGAPNVLNVLGGDTLNGAPATTAGVTIAVASGSSVPAGLTFDAATGNVSVNPNTPAGTYSFNYTICETLNPANCSTATASVTVAAAPIAATPDTATGINGATGGNDVVNAYTNDTLNGAPVNPAAITGTVLTPATPINGGPVPVLDPATGLVDVPAGTPAGTYTIGYRICETLNTANCADSTVTVTVVAPAITAAPDSVTGINGTTGASNVLNVLAGDTLNGVPANLADVTLAVAAGSSVPAGLTFDPATGNVSVNPNTPAGTYSFDYTVCEKLNPTNCATSTASVAVAPPLSTLSGIVYDDLNYDDVRQPNEPLRAGWTVEVVRNGAVVGTAVTDATGAYTVANLPSGPGYSVRFRTPDTNVVFAVVSDVTLANDATVNQNLPIDPSGVFYDTVTRQPVAGVIATFTDRAGNALPTACFVDASQQNQRTGVTGQYRFDIVPGAASQCPVGESGYGIVFAAPAGYSSVPSTVIAPEAGALDPTGRGNPVTVVSGAGAPQAGEPTTYYLAFTLGSGDPHVVNNHIPLDPFLTRAPLVVTKTTSQRSASVGDLVPYTITVRNTEGLRRTNVTVVDVPPSGFSYVPGTARINGVASEPVVADRQLSWTGQTIPANGSIRYDLMMVVGAGVTQGEKVNTALSRDNAGTDISNRGTAVVAIVASQIFDCSELIGKVFDDADRDGYQDEGERGLPNVRLVTVNGQLITTDAQGRYHIACAAVPDARIGSNFVLKLDPRTLPAGYAPTQDNPQSIRLTRGKLGELNFGAAALERQIVQLNAGAFGADGKLLPAYSTALARLPETAMGERPAIVLEYALATAEDRAAAERRLTELAETIRQTFTSADAAARRTARNVVVETILVRAERASGRE